MARHERSFEDLQEIMESTRDLISRVKSRLDCLGSIIKVRVNWKWNASED